MAKIPTLYGTDKDDIFFGSGEDEMGYVPPPYIDQGTKPRIIRAKKWESMPVLSGPEKEKGHGGIPDGMSKEQYSSAISIFGQEFVDNLSERKAKSKILMKVELSPKGRRLGLKAEEDGIYTSSGMKICGRLLIC